MKHLARRVWLAAKTVVRNAELERLQDRNVYLESKLDEIITLAEGAPLETGVCMCGDPVEDHNFSSGHSPVDIWDHAFSKFREGLDQDKQKRIKT